MKIADLSQISVHLPASEGSSPAAALFVRVATAAGPVSLAEAVVPSPEHLADAVELFGSVLIGRSVRDRGELWEQMTHALASAKWPLSEYAGALGAVDMALWELAAEAYGVPLYQLLGGAHFSSVDTYTLASRVMDKPQQLLDWLTSCRGQATGGIGITIGQVNPENLRAIERIREEIGSNRRLILRVAESCPDLESAHQVANRLERLELFWCENLLSNAQGKAYAKLRASTDLPLAAGRELYGIKQFYQLVRAQAVDVVVVDLRYCGITVARRVADLARLENIRVAFTGGVSPLTTLAAAHLSANCPVAMPLGLPSHFLGGLGELFVTSAQLSDGFISLSDQPGLGGELKLDQWEVQESHE